MIWHIVHFDCSGVDAATRDEIERQLEGLAAIDVVAFLRVARDIDHEHVTGLITAFASREDLETYRTHPDHLPVIDTVRGAGVKGIRLDVETDDRVEDLP